MSFIRIPIFLVCAVLAFAPAVHAQGYDDRPWSDRNNADTNDPFARPRDKGPYWEDEPAREDYDRKYDYLKPKAPEQINNHYGARRSGSLSDIQSQQLERR